MELLGHGFGERHGLSEGVQDVLGANILLVVKSIVKRAVYRFFDFRAAEILVPEWISRGSGYFVAVASAAGLLTQLGCAGYAVTKHAAVGFAEWLAITYGDDGIGVSCVCPLGVDTPLMESVRAHAEPAARLGAESVLRSGDVISPDEVAALTVEAVRAGRFLVLPHPQVLEMYRHKGSDYDRWIAGMRRYQRSLG